MLIHVGTRPHESTPLSGGMVLVRGHQALTESTRSAGALALSTWAPGPHKFTCSLRAQVLIHVEARPSVHMPTRSAGALADPRGHQAHLQSSPAQQGHRC